MIPLECSTTHPLDPALLARDRRPARVMHFIHRPIVRSVPPLWARPTIPSTDSEHRPRTAFGNRETAGLRPEDVTPPRVGLPYSDTRISAETMAPDRHFLCRGIAIDSTRFSTQQIGR
jgi:hypothetical protein